MTNITAAKIEKILEYFLFVLYNAKAKTSNTISAHKKAKDNTTSIRFLFIPKFK